MSDLLKILESFNRKERFFLIAQALGQYSKGVGQEKKPEFTLCEEFRADLSEKVNIEVPKEPKKSSWLWTII